MTFFTRLIFALFGMAFAVLFAVGVLCWLAIYLAFASLRWLLTGQKPQVLLMWQQIQAMRKGMQAGQGAGWSSGPRPSDGQWESKADVIEDAVVREIHDKPGRPKD